MLQFNLSPIFLITFLKYDLSIKMWISVLSHLHFFVLVGEDIFAGWSNIFGSRYGIKKPEMTLPTTRTGRRFPCLDAGIWTSAFIFLLPFAFTLQTSFLFRSFI